MDKHPNFTQNNLHIEVNNGPIFGGTTNIYGEAPKHHSQMEAETIDFEDITPQSAPTSSLSQRLAKVAEVLFEMYSRIPTQRHWFAICKGLMKLKLVGDGDFKNAVQLILDSLPENLRPKLNYKDLQKLNVLSFVKDIDQWDASDSPVGKNTPEYQTLALQFMSHFDYK